ncbi:MAG: hypothetical protein O2917_06365 [Acidobacteria bacterium]|nr:hypothetical protein [Acidobacteriota bacterium]
MTESEAQAAILERLRTRGGIVLAGNKENWTEIRWTADGWLREDGDTLSGEREVCSVTDAEVLAGARARVTELARYVYETPVPRTWQEVLDQLPHV